MNIQSSPLFGSDKKLISGKQSKKHFADMSQERKEELKAVVDQLDLYKGAPGIRGGKVVVHKNADRTKAESIRARLQQKLAAKADNKPH